MQEDVNRTALSRPAQHTHERLVAQRKPERVNEKEDGTIRVSVEQVVDDVFQRAIKQRVDCDIGSGEVRFESAADGAVRLDQGELHFSLDRLGPLRTARKEQRRTGAAVLVAPSS